MNKTLAIFGALALFSLTDAAEQPGAAYRTFKGAYTIYSQGLGDQQVPTRSDRKLSIVIDGQAAKEIFNAMPPDDKETCSADKGARSRTRENVWCTFNPADGYTCYFGFDLRTGKSIGGGLC